MNRIQAMELDGQIRKHLEEYSLQNGLNPAFGNTIMDKYLQIIPDTAKREMIFLGDKSASYKMGNIRLDIKSGLVAVAEFVASLSKTENVFQYTQLMIISVLCIVAISEKELDYDSAVVVYALHKQNACPIHNPIAFRIRRIRENEPINEEIRELVENNRNKIAIDIRKITGILLKNERINRILDDYIAARDYCYTHTNRYNIPYSILYTRESINLFGQKIDTSDLGERITLAIRNNSRYFDVKVGRIIKTVEEFVSLYLLVANHRVQGSKQYMTISIEERGDANYVLFQEEVEMKQYIY